MRRMLHSGCLALAACALMGQDRPPVASYPVVELKGTVAKVQVTPGAGMPSLEIRSGKETTTVMLGSIRYLMEQDFNPKAGETAIVKGYRMEGRVIAIRVELPERKKTLQLRDANGWPLWMGRGRGGPKSRK